MRQRTHRVTVPIIDGNQRSALVAMYDGGWGGWSGMIGTFGQNVVIIRYFAG